MNFAAALADRVAVLDGGRVVIEGEAGEIMSDSRLMAKHGLELPSGVLGN